MAAILAASRWSQRIPYGRRVRGQRMTPSPANDQIQAEVVGGLGQRLGQGMCPDRELGASGWPFALQQRPDAPADRLPGPGLL
jgi:hypothetical protein